MSEPDHGREDEDAAKLALEREKLAIDTKIREQELTLKMEEARRSRWASPLVLAVVGATLATAGNGVVTWMSGKDQRELEDSRSRSNQKILEENNEQQLLLESFKAESGRILEAIKTANPDSAATNLQFLLDAGLVNNKATADYLKHFLATRKPGQGPALPAPSGEGRPGLVSSSDIQQLAHSGNTLGIDAGTMNRKLDFSQLKAHGVSFAYLRATQGTTRQDPVAEEYAQAAHAQGLKVGLYHVFDPNDETAQQIEKFKDRLAAIQWELPPAIDVSDLGRKGSKAKLSSQVREFAEGIESTLGVRPVLYTDTHFANEYLDESLHGYPLWLAKYGAQAPTAPNGWSGYLIWQLAEGVQDDPVLKGLDINAYKGSIDDLAALGRKK